MIEIPSSYLLMLFSKHVLTSEYIYVPSPISGLPSTAEVIGVWHDYAKDAFLLLVEDESFENVPEGVSYPILKVEWRTVRRFIPKAADSSDLRDIAEKMANAIESTYCDSADPSIAACEYRQLFGEL